MKIFKRLEYCLICLRKIKYYLHLTSNGILIFRICQSFVIKVKKTATLCIKKLHHFISAVWFHFRINLTGNFDMLYEVWCMSIYINLRMLMEIHFPLTYMTPRYNCGLHVKTDMSVWFAVMPWAIDLVK